VYCLLHQLKHYNAWFPAFRIRCRCIAVAVAVKNRVRTCRLCHCCWGMCAAISPQAQEAGHRVSRIKEWAKLQARTNGRYGKTELNPIWTDERQRRTYGNGERYFVCKLRSSYRILTDERNSMYSATETATAKDTERGKPGVMQVLCDIFKAN